MANDIAEFQTYRPTPENEPFPLRYGSYEKIDPNRERNH